MSAPPASIWLPTPPIRPASVLTVSAARLICFEFGAVPLPLLGIPPGDVFTSAVAAARMAADVSQGIRPAASHRGMGVKTIW